jgi:hypothetical protein
VALYERFELLALHRDDGVKTFHAREIATRRPVHVHLFSDPNAPQHAALLARLDRLPITERRRIIERGEVDGAPYVVTDRLVDQPGFREWLNAKALPLELRKSLHQAGKWKVPEPAPAQPAGVDEQFAALFETEGEGSPAEAGATTEVPTPPASMPVAKSVLGLIMGIAAALLFLGLLVALYAFRPRSG